MYLKALEIQGFKSFPDKTVLTFGEDITAIVGPNGSGKSNISDAIRWVMGEQSSKALRGGKMEDVIFGGTAVRRQQGFAEVSLVLDNTDHIFPMEESEVMVTRRYYRSGESEYYINRRSVRLKDVNELFMDTGLGREGYSIIGQGRIDEILSVKSADRREVFEEAAGISRYRHRKEEAERRLERTDENLVRINDKISELELQVEPLREQSEKAKKYLVLRDELRGLEISVWLDTLERIRASNIKLEADYQETARQREEARTAQEKAYAAAETYSAQMREKDVEADRLRFEMQGREAQANELESAIAVLKSSIQHNLESAARLKADLEQQEGREGSLSAQIEQRRERLEEIEGQLARTQSDLKVKGQEAEETAQLWEILCGVLDQFVEILGEEHLEQSEFERLFRLVLTQYSVGTIPVALDQVSVGEITRNDRHTTSYLFLLGANDHVLPDPGQSGGLLNEDDRQALALRGVELAPTGMERMGIELQNLYAALAQPTAGLTVSYPVTDVSGSELRPAFVVERLRKLFPELRVEHERADKAYRLSAVEPALEMAGQDPDGPLWRYFQQEPDCARHLSAMERAAAARRGSLSPAAVRAIYGERVSMTASRLERMRSCHFAYFMEYGLRAKPREPASFDAPQIGTFLHYLLENVTRDVLGQGGFAAVDNKELHRLTRQYIDQYAEQELHNFQNRTPRFRYLFNRLRTNAYAIIDQVAEELRHSDFVPMAFELGFGGKDGTLPAVTISRPDGELRVGGKVDRVDGWIKDDKLYLRVVDYKSGKKKFDLANVRMGLDIQMLLYLFALQKEGAEFFGKEIEPAGVLYLPARDEILPAERGISQEALQKEREKTLKRSGLLLEDPAVLQAMEHEALTEPHYLPLRVGKDGNLSGSLASAARLGKLGTYVDKLLGQISDELRSGNIDADPCCHSEEDSQCRFCDWVSACQFRDGRDRDRLRYILPVKPEEFWKELEEGGGDPWQS